MAVDYSFGLPVQSEVLRVLLVDGDPHLRAEVAATLGASYDVSHVATMREGLAIIERDAPHVIISEVDLPDGSGLTFFQRVRLMPGGDNLPLILLTSRGTASDKIAGFDAGADDYLVKPFDATMLPSRVSLMVRIRGMEQATLFPF